MTSKYISRREFTKFAFAGAALAGGSGLGHVASAVAQDRAFEGQAITHWSFLSPEGTSLREQAINEIEERFKARTGIEVNYEIFPWSELRTRIIAAVQAGNAPDSTRVDFSALQTVLRGEALTSLDSYIDQTFSDNEKEDFVVDFSSGLMIDDHKWAMLLETIPQGFYVRKDWLDELGMPFPKTWDEVVEVAKAMTGNGRWGYMFFASKAMLIQMNYMQPHIRGRGGLILDEAGRAAFNNDATADAFQFFSDCVHKHKITPPDVISMSYEDQSDAFRAGRVGMFIEGSHRYRDNLRAVGAENVQVVEIPSNDPNRPSPTNVAGWGIGIPHGAANPDVAWEHIKHFISPEAQEINARIAGSIPSRRSVAESDYFQTEEAAYMRWWLNYVAENSEPQFNVPTFSQLNEILTNALHHVLLDSSANIGRILADAADEYDRVVDAA